MKAVLTHQGCLSKLQLRSPSQQLQFWTSQKTLYQQYTSLTKSLGKPVITAAQAKKLVSIGFSHTTLVKLYSEAKDGDDFSKSLKAKGVNSKALQVKLGKLLGSKINGHRQPS